MPRTLLAPAKGLMDPVTAAHPRVQTGHQHPLWVTSRD